MNVEQLAKLLRAAKLYVGPLMVTDEEGAAAALSCSRKTLQNWRDDGEGPSCYQTSRWIYPLDGLLIFLEKTPKSGKSPIPKISPPLADSDESRSTKGRR